MTDELELDLEVEPQGEPMHVHPLDPISLAFGVIFTIVGGVFLFGNVNAADLAGAAGWSLLLGAVGLVLIAVGIRRHRR